MEENKVVLKLEDYIKMLDKIKEYENQAKNINSNYDRMCNYLKEEVSSSGNYHIRNVISDKLNLDETLNMKLKNYHYEQLASEFIKVGITYDLIEKLVDGVIREYQMKKEEEENNDKRNS